MIRGNAPFAWTASLPDRRRHLLDLDDWTREEIETLLDSAERMLGVLANPIPKVPALNGKTVINVFYEDSTRTRVSFELAGKHMSADVVNVSASGSSVAKGESLVDTIRTLEATGADVIVLRHPSAGAANLAAAHCQGAVVNAGDGWHAHPTQALLDALTIRRRVGGLVGKKVAIVGDVLHSRVARSNAWALSILGAQVVLCGPPTLLPRDLPWGERVTRTERLADALVDADVVMALRLQQERMQSALIPSLREYSQNYQINDISLRSARADVLVLHPGPMNLGIEIDPACAHGQRSAIEEQVANGVAVRMAVLYLLAGAAR